MDKLIRKKFIASCKKGMEEVGDFHLFFAKKPLYLAWRVGLCVVFIDK